METTYKSHKYKNLLISFAIKQVRNILNTDSLKTLYFAHIQPYINYGILAWGNESILSILSATLDHYVENLIF